MVERAVFQITKEGLEAGDLDALTGVANADGQTLQIVVRTQLHVPEDPGMVSGGQASVHVEI
jgi:hypothetical protein